MVFLGIYLGWVRFPLKFLVSEINKNLILLKTKCTHDKCNIN